MGSRNTIDPAVRAAIEHELEHPHDPPRSRAAIAREHGVTGRTVSRYAEGLGIAPADAWRTDTIAAATKSATERRRGQRSDLADLLLTTEVPRLLERLAAGHSGDWHKSVVVVGEFGGVEQADEDDAIVARGLKDLHAALKTAVDQTIAIDKTDVDNGDQAATKALDNLFTGLGQVAELVRRGRGEDPPDDEETAA